MLAEIGLPGLKEEDLPKLLGPDKYEQELIVMAEVSAFFRVSYKVCLDDENAGLASRSNVLFVSVANYRQCSTHHRCGLPASFQERYPSCIDR